MATSIVIPREGQSMETAVIVKWLAKVGDTISFAQPICEVESEKALFEIESPVEGTLLDVFYEEGDAAPVLKAIAVVGKPGEKFDDLKPADEAKAIDEVKDQAEIMQTVEQQEAPQKETGVEEKRTLISPRAKKLLNDKGIDPAKIDGDLIQEADVLAHIAASANLTPAAAERVNKTGESLPQQATGIGGRISVDDLIDAASTAGAHALTGMRKTIADRMHQSLIQTAQYTLNCYVDATGLLDLRKRLKKSDLGLSSISINDILLLSVARTLDAVKTLNAQYADGELTQVDDVNLGFAVSLDNGLMVPVIHGAQKLSLKQVSDKAKALAEACKKGNAKQEMLSGGTFTVSNLGALGIDTFTPILNYPEVGILGVGEIAPKAIERNGDIAFVNHLALSLTLNHQIIDGAEGAKFLKLLGDNIKNIDTLLAI